MKKNAQLFTRLGASNDEMENLYGPLAGLIGTWSGNKGVNLVAVPDQKGSFKLLVAPYSETLTITALSSPTPNRGLHEIQHLPTLMYSLSIYNSIDNSLMHAENGIWNLIDKKADDGMDLLRLTSVPHGDSVAALGNSSVTKGRPDIDVNFSSNPTGPGIPPLGYSESQYNVEYVPGFVTRRPNQWLADHLTAQEAIGQKVIHTTNLPVSTLNKGGITNIPSLVTNANPTQFDSIFWIETVHDANTGQDFQQLQYTQNINIQFPIGPTFKGIINWPHVTVNTLIKQ